MNQDQARAMFEEAMLREAKCQPEFLKWNGDRYDFESMELAWAGFQLGIQAGLTQPPGYALVPVEPTQEMIDAADESDRGYSQRAFGGSMHLCQSGEDHWHVMLAAAQKERK